MRVNQFILVARRDRRKTITKVFVSSIMNLLNFSIVLHLQRIVI